MIYTLIVVTIASHGAVNVQHVADDFTSYQSWAAFAVAWMADRPLRVWGDRLARREEAGVIRPRRRKKN